jgi:predicted MFS family arabinose efflux permease
MATTSFVAQALILVFLVEAHSRQLSTMEIGIVLAASGAGGATGSLCSRVVLARVRSWWLPIQMVAWSVALFFLWLVGGQSVCLSVIAMFILGFTGAIGNIEFGTYLVNNVADDMIAKVSGTGQMLAIGACGLGPVLSGYAVQHFQVEGAIAFLLIVMTLLIIASLLTKEGRQQVTDIWSVIYEFIGYCGNIFKGRAHALVENRKASIAETSGAADTGQAGDREEESRDVAYNGVAVLRA